MIILVDTREKKPYGFEGFGAEAEKKALPTGDYSVDDFAGRDGELKGVIVERKSVGDMGSSLLKPKRFESRIPDWLEFKRHLVVVDGSMRRLINWVPKNDGPCIWNGRRAFQRLVRLQAEYGFNLVFSDTRHLAETWVYQFLRNFWLNRNQIMG